MGLAATAADSCAMSPRSPALHVFIADDSAPIRERVRELLAGAGMTITGEAGTPQGCIDAILAAHPDVVVLDVQLEGGSGLEVLQKVRATCPSTAFVVFSNNSAPAYRQRYLGAGAAAFLDKSAEFGQLAHAVVQACHHPLH